MQVGDIRYRVYTNTDKKIWICRCRVVKKSPKGRVITFWPFDCQKPKEFKDNVGGNVTSKTKIGSLKEYQERAITSWHWDSQLRSGITVEQRIEGVIEAQKQIDKIMFCPTI